MQRGPWDTVGHVEPFRSTDVVEAVGPISSVRPVSLAAYSQDLARPSQAIHPKERKRITSVAPHPYEDLFDETHVDFLA